MNLENEVFIKYGDDRFLLFISKKVLDLIGDSEQVVLRDWLGSNWGYNWGGDTWRNAYRYFPCGDCFDVDSARETINAVLKGRCAMGDKEIEDNIKIVATGEVGKDGQEIIMVLISKYFLNCIGGGTTEEVCHEKLHAKWGWRAFGTEDTGVILKDLGLNPCDYRAKYVYVDSRKDALRIKEEVISTVKRALVLTLKPTII